MGDRICSQKVGKHTDTEQNNKAYRNRGAVGDRSSNLVKLIGAKRISRRDYKYEGTYYVTNDGEVYDSKYVNTHDLQRTGISFYEVADWLYNESKQIYEPTIRRIVIVEKREYQLSLNL